jgi:HlyD family secretion protein
MINKIMRKIFGILMVLFLFVSFFGGGYYLYQKSEEEPVVFESDSPFYSDIINKTVATGSIVPRKEIELKSQVSGVVEKIYVEPGEFVKEGDLIAKIEIIPDVVSLNNAQNRLQTALINFQNAEKEHQRQIELYEQRVISEFDYNQFLLQYNLAKQDVEAAENNLELVKEGASKKTGNISNLVRSTAKGMVLDVPVEEGNFVIESNTFNDGTTIGSVANMDEMIFEGKVDESEVGKIREGMDLKLMIGALEDVSFDAKLEYISPKGIEEEGAIQFEIKAAIKLLEGVFLRAAYSANADIVLDRRDSVLSIKEKWLKFDDDGQTYVELEVGEQKYERRDVETGLSDGINIEIISGLKKDDNIKSGKVNI